MNYQVSKSEDQWREELTPVEFHILREAGKFIGIGRFRPRNNGYYGRFDVESVDWK